MPPVATLHASAQRAHAWRGEAHMQAGQHQDLAAALTARQLMQAEPAEAEAASEDR